MMVAVAERSRVAEALGLPLSKRLVEKTLGG